MAAAMLFAVLAVKFEITAIMTMIALSLDVLWSMNMPFRDEAVCGKAADTQTYGLVHLEVCCACYLSLYCKAVDFLPSLWLQRTHN